VAMLLVRKVSTRCRFRCTRGRPESSQTQRTFVALSSVTRRLAAMQVLSRGAAQAHHNNTSRSGFRNSHGVFRGLAHAARIGGGLCEFARTPQQSLRCLRRRSRNEGPFWCLSTCVHINIRLFQHLLTRIYTLTTSLTLTATPTTCAFITPTGSSKVSCRPLGLKLFRFGCRSRSVLRTDEVVGYDSNPCPPRLSCRTPIRLSLDSSMGGSSSRTGGYKTRIANQK
jgi:hypothetical protein